jgi:hypothetical protein
MSSTYRVLKPYSVFNNVVADTTQYSDITDTSGLLQLEYDIFWNTGSSFSGTITVEVLQVRPSDDPATWTWQTLDLGSTVSTSGTSGIHNIVFTVVPMNAIRLKFTSITGSALLTATIKGKGW